MIEIYVFLFVLFFAVLLLGSFGLSLPSVHLILMGSFVALEVMLIAWMIKRSCLVFRRGAASLKDE